MTLSPLFFNIFNHFFKLLNCDYYFFKILGDFFQKICFLASRGSFLKIVLDFSKKDPLMAQKTYFFEKKIKLFTSDLYFLRFWGKNWEKTRFLACRGSFLKFFDFSKKTPYGPKNLKKKKYQILKCYH